MISSIWQLKILIILFSFFPLFAYAYIDPGMGSYIFQLLIGVILAGVFTFRTFWLRVGAFLSKLLSRNKDEESERK